MFVWHCNRGRYGSAAPNHAGGLMLLHTRPASCTSNTLLQACRNEVVQIAIEYRLRIADFMIGAQVLDA